MTIDDLLILLEDAEDSRAGIRAVVEALRDEIVPPEYTHLTNTEKGWLQFFNEILAIAGEVKAAGGSTSNASKAIGEGGALSAPGTPTPAAAPFTAEDWLCLAKGTEFEHYAGVSETKGILFREKAPAAEPVCNWVINEKRFFDVDPTIYYDTGCGSMFRYVYKQCQGCGKPISFKSEAAR